MSCHNELRYKVAELAIKYLTPNHVRNVPLIDPDCAVQSRKAFMYRSNPPNNLLEMAIES